MNSVLAATLLYVLAQLAIGFAVSRRVKTEEDYLLGGRRFGYPLAIFSTFATWFGAETCIGAAGAMYAQGLSGSSADPFGYGLCLLLMGFLFAAPLWRRRLTTLPDLFRERFSPAVERFAIALMVPASLLWAAAQIRAFGQVLTTTSELQLSVCIGIAAAVAVVYTAAGGLLADAVTDVVQGLVLMLGLLVVGFAVIDGSGGLSAALSAVPADKLQILGGARVSWLGKLDAWAVPICGSVFAQELVARVLASRSEQVARRAPVVAGVLYMAFGLIPLLAGLLGIAVLPGLDDPELVLPSLAQRYLPGLAYAVFAGALVSAILSTVDSTLLVCASLVSHNLVPSLRPGLSDAARTRLARAGVVVFGVLAYAIALQAEGVYSLVKDASAFGSSGIFVIAVLGLFSRRGQAPSALAALAVGLGSWAVGVYVYPFEGVYACSLVAALLAYFSLLWSGAPAAAT
jgi:Na+/proline symporter